MIGVYPGSEELNTDTMNVSKESTEETFIDEVD